VNAYEAIENEFTKLQEHSRERSYQTDNNVTVVNVKSLKDT
jgi:hypothetical protein